jgi:hypothetical protein
MTQEEKLKASFPLFLFLVWRQLGLPDPTTVQIDIAKWLQHGGRRIVIEAFRGVGKSWITSAYVCWLLLRDDTKKILVVSASKERSDAFSIFTKRLLTEIPCLQHLRPSRALGDRISNVAFDVRGAIGHASSVKSVGITGQMTGSRADHIVVDDCEVANNSETASQREKLLTLVSEMGGAILTPTAQAGATGGIVFLGTPQVEDSMYAKLPDRGYQIKVWPAEVPGNPDAYEGNLAPCIIDMLESSVPAGTPTEPTRFGTAELAERKLEYGAAGFSLQFQLDTTLADSDRNPLKLADFIVAKTDVEICPDKLVWGRGEDQEMGHIPLMGLPGDRLYRNVPILPAPLWSKYEGAIMYVDPSGRGRDLTSYCVVKQMHGMLIIRAWGGLTGGYDVKTLSKLSHIAKEEKVNTVVIESNFGDGMFAELLKPVLWEVYPNGCSVEDDHVSAQKELRICDNLEPALAMHRIVLDEEVVNGFVTDRSGSRDNDAVLKTAFYQLTRITRDRGCLKYDDLIDCLAGAVRYWTLKMARDVTTSIGQRDRSRTKKMLQDFQRGISISGKSKNGQPINKRRGNATGVMFE